MISLSTILITIALGALFLVLFNKKLRDGLPPGPFAYPIIGNLITMGMSPFDAFKIWPKKYGKLYTILFGSQKMVVINDPVLIREAFNDPRVSGRPDDDAFTMLTDGPHGVLNSSGQEWVDQRRFTLRHLRDFGFAKNAMEELIMEEANEFISTLKKTEGQSIALERKFNLAVLNSLWRIMSGERLGQEDPKLSKLLDELSKMMTESTGVMLVAMFFPRLGKLFPTLTGYNTFTKIVRDHQDFANKSINEHVKNKPEDGIPRDFMDAYLKEIESTKDTNSSFYKEAGLKSLMAVVLDLFNAGSGTTAMTLCWLFLYLTKFTDIQRKLQEELDTVIGKNRQVTLADRPNLPYTEATILEALRYSSLLPFSGFHKVMTDMEFHGYHLPKGTWVTANQYYVHYNNDLWDSPETFNPERFLSEDGKKVKRSENLISFSVGKRQCLGETLARDEVFLFITNIFQRFNVRLADESVNVPLVSKGGPMLVADAYSVVFSDRT